MKKTLLLLLILLLNAFFVSAQNWNCFLPNIKQFFTNANGYLRGMRIDSIKTSGTDTIYYPFHSMRGNTTLMPVFDSNGGSWLGKKVVKQADGTFLFDDIGNDTVVIRTQAIAGDNWIFYSDTSPVYYMADVVSVDTMTVLSVLDSVKTLSITAYNNGNIVTNSPVNNFRIILSKEHGFVKVFDLYTFPYRDSSGYDAFDYYFSMVQVHGYLYGYWASYNVIDNYQQFDLTTFHYPTLSEIYDYNIGDVISTQSETDYESAQVYIYSTSYDSIISKTVSANGVSYTNVETSIGHTDAQVGSTSWGPTANTTNTNIMNTMLFDTVRMPEEWNVHEVYYYFPYDTSNCFISSVYAWYYDFTNGVNVLPGPHFEYCGTNANRYKAGVGALDVESYSGIPLIVGPPGCTSNYKFQEACKKNGLECYGCHLLGVSSMSGPDKSMNVYPNPANNELSIKLPSNNKHTVSLINILGEVVLKQKHVLQQTTFDVADIPTGVYVLRIEDENGQVLCKKIVVHH